MSIEPNPYGLDGPPVADDWIALHIFYSSNSNPLLDECIAPLTTSLHRRGLIDHWFFIRYWMEGPHIRLRLHPKKPEDRSDILTEATSTIAAYMKARPSLYKLNPDVVGTLYKDMFLAEYTEEQWNETYGADNTMPLKDSNTVVEYPYEPEYVKYGGMTGLQISHEQFAASSDLVLELLATTNLHVREVMFGVALQIMTATTTAFLPSAPESVQFHEGYQKIWESSFLPRESKTREGFEVNYLEMREKLDDRLGTIRTAMAAGEGDQLPGFLGPWIAHCLELRERIATAAAAGTLVFAVDYRTGERAVTEDVDFAMQSLLVPYLHMTNNRLGVSIVEEVYLSHLLARHLTDSLTHSPALPVVGNA